MQMSKETQPYCPSCHKVFDHNETICKDCLVELKLSNSEISDDDDGIDASKLSCIKEDTSAEYIKVLSTILEKNHIYSYMHCVTKPRVHAHAVYYQLYVLKEECEVSVKLLHDSHDEITHTVLHLVKEDTQCSKCNSKNLTKTTFLTLFEKIFFKNSEIFVCERCGKRIVI